MALLPTTQEGNAQWPLTTDRVELVALTSKRGSSVSGPYPQHIPNTQVSVPGKAPGTLVTQGQGTLLGVGDC